MSFSKSPKTDLTDLFQVESVVYLKSNLTPLADIQWFKFSPHSKTPWYHCGVVISKAEHISERSDWYETFRHCPLKKNNSIRCFIKWPQNDRCFSFKRESPLAAVVIMTGATEEVRWRRYSPRREDVRVDGWANKTSDFNIGDCALFVNIIFLIPQSFPYPNKVFTHDDEHPLT